MSINLAPERSTLSLPGARLRPEGAGSGKVEADAAKLQRAPGQNVSIQVSREAPAEVSALRALAGELNFASSVADVALAATEEIQGLLEQLRELTASVRGTGAQRGEAFGALIGAIHDQTKAAGFGGVNLLDGSLPSGALKLPATADASAELALTARDLRPGGPLVTVGAASEPADAQGAVETSLANVETTKRELREEAKRVDAHGAFLRVLSDAVAGEARPQLDIDGARLAALSIRQALGGQGLSVSNAAPQAVLSLFR